MVISDKHIKKILIRILTLSTIIVAIFTPKMCKNCYNCVKIATLCVKIATLLCKNCYI